MTLSENTNPLDILQMALKKEKGSYEFYREAAQKLNNPGAKKMFEFLAEEEIKHQQLIQDEMDKGFYRDM